MSASVNSNNTKSSAYGPMTLGYNMCMQKQTIYDRIIEARKDAGQDTSQTSIARDIGIFQSAVGKWKRGKGASHDHMLWIARTTGVCVEYLYTGRGLKHPAKPDVVDLMNDLDALSETDRAAVIRFAKAYDPD